MLYRKIDENDLFIEDVINPLITEENEHLYIKTPIPDGTYAKRGVSPKWTGTEWVATSEPPEPTPQVPNEVDYLMLAMADLDMQRSMDKTETELAITELAEFVLLGGM